MSAMRFALNSLARFQSRIVLSPTSLVRSFPASSLACLNLHRPVHSLAVQEPSPKPDWHWRKTQDSLLLQFKQQSQPAP